MGAAVMKPVLVEPVQLAALGTSVTTAVAGWTADGISIQFLGVPLATLLLAFAGSIISLTWVKTHRSWWVVIGAGTLIGAICAPLVAWGAGMTPEKAIALEKALAFTLGLTVQAVVPSFLEWIKRRGSGASNGGGGGR